MEMKATVKKLIAGRQENGDFIDPDMAALAGEIIDVEPHNGGQYDYYSTSGIGWSWRAEWLEFSQN